MKKFAAILILAAACGKEEVRDTTTAPTTSATPEPYHPPIRKTLVDDSLVDIFTQFKQDCEKREDKNCLTILSDGRLESVKMVGVDILRKDPGSENRVGVCYAWVDSQNKLVNAQIEILNNNGRGQEWDPHVLKGILYHELGHCVLGLPHTCNPNTTACAVDYNNPSMMWPWIYSRQTYEAHWTKMVEDMFLTIGRMFSLTLGLTSSDSDLVKYTIE